MLAVGLMSGTSLDGIDAVLCEIEGFGVNTKLKQIDFCTLDIPVVIKNKIRECCLNEKPSIDILCSLNFELGLLFSKAVKKVCSKAGVKTNELGFIASHGQTIYHIPHSNTKLKASTLQIGEASVISQECQCTVINNFRTKDMAVGGEGAPLVPYSEYILYRDRKKNIALQNIGGIGNVTILPKDCSIDDVYAFDTGPGNMMIDEAMNLMYNKNYDVGGSVASKGKIILALKQELSNHDYLSIIPPKTTGREMFGEQYVKVLLKKYSKEKRDDIIATFTWFTAYSIAESYRRFVLPYLKIDEIILGGGGAHNNTLLNMLKQELKNINIYVQEDKGYSSDAKEAIAFVILGNETLNFNFSNVPRATGARQKVILGQITYPN